MKVGPLYEALKEAEVRITAGAGAASLNFMDAECFRAEEAPVGADSALKGPGDLGRVEAGSGER